MQVVNRSPKLSRSCGPARIATVDGLLVDPALKLASFIMEQVHLLDMFGDEFVPVALPGIYNRKQRTTAVAYLRSRGWEVQRTGRLARIRPASVSTAQL